MLCQQSPLSSEIVNADKRSFSAGIRAPPLRANNRTQLSTQKLFHVSKAAATPRILPPYQCRPRGSIFHITLMPPHHESAVGQMRTLLNLFCDKHLSHHNGDNIPTGIRSFPFKFHAHPSISASISTLMNKRGFDLKLMKQQRFSKCLGRTDTESRVLVNWKRAGLD